MTSQIVRECGRRDVDLRTRERLHCTRCSRGLALLALLASGGFGACHKAMTRVATADGAVGAGGAAGSGGVYLATSEWSSGGAKDDGGALGGVGGTVTGGGGTHTSTGGSPGADAGAVGSGGTAAGGTAGTTAGSEPVDDRPPRPEWKPPFTTPLGSPGWKQSTQPICDANQGQFAYGAFDVWADARGVFALVGEGCEPGQGMQCGKDGASIKFNSGSGWQLRYQFPPGAAQSPRMWPSVDNGPLLVTGQIEGYGTGAAFIDYGTANGADHRIAGFHAIPGAYGAFAFGPDPAAYLLDATRLLRYSSGTWSTVADLGDGALPLAAVWAGPDGAIVSGYNQTIATQEGAAPLTFLSGVPAGQYLAIWAFGPSDVWFGNSANQLLHYDGNRWQVHATGSKSTGGIWNLWGASGTVYFTTRTEFGRWNGSRVEILLQAQDQDQDPNDGPFGGVWGRSVDEVFVAIRDARYRDTACGSVFMLWFDGAQFHQF